MEETIIAVSPYKASILKALYNAIIVKLSNFVLVGNKKKIIETCFVHNISHSLFEIVDCENDIDICFAVNDLVKKRKTIGMLIGDLSEIYIKNIAQIEYEINVVDVPFSNHLLFISNYLKDEYIGYEEKANSIKACKGLMNDLKIKYVNIGLVSGQANKIVNIEKNIMKMDNTLDDDNIDVIGINDIFEEQYNLLVFNNIDASKIFIDTIIMNDRSKYANLKKASNTYVVDANKMKLKDVFFSIFLLHKITLNSKAS